MTRIAIFDDPSQSINGSPDRLNKWGKHLDSADSKRQSRYSKSDCANGLLSRQGQLVPRDPKVKGMNRHYQQQQQQSQHQQQQQHPSNRISYANGNGGNGSTASKAIANPTSLPPLSLNNYVPSMLVPNSNQNTNHSQAQQQQQGHNPSTSGRPSIPANNNNAAWLQHMILNPINPLQNNPNSIGNNAGGNGSSGISHQANVFAQQQQLQGNIHGSNTEINYYHQQQVSNQLGDTTIGTSSIATSISKQQQQQQQQHQHQQTLKQSLLASQQVWPSQGQQQQQQQQNLQQGLQLNQLLSLQQQQQFLPLNELTSQLQLPSARQTQQLQHQQQQTVATRNINELAVLPTAVSAQPSAQQQQQQLLLLASMLQQDNANKNGNSVNVSSLSAALASPEGMRLLQSFLLGQQTNQVQQQQQQNNRLAHDGNAGTGPAGSSNLGVSHLSPVPTLGMGEDALSNQHHFFQSQQSQQPQLQSQSQQLHGIPSPMPVLNRTDPNMAGNIGESPLGANTVNQHFPSPADGPSAALTRNASPSNRFDIPNLSMPADLASFMIGSKTNAERGFPPSGRSTKNDKNTKGNNRTSTANSQFPSVLYYEADDDILGEYQTLLRQQLELFEADSHDVINGTFRQGRTTPIRLGQIGLRCKHCAKTPLSVRTKGSVYFSQTIKGMYQIGQNMSKVHLCERCTLLPPDIKKRMIALRSRRHRASGGRAYWIRHMRELGIYEDGTVLRAHPLEERKKPHEKTASAPAPTARK